MRLRSWLFGLVLFGLGSVAVVRTFEGSAAPSRPALSSTLRERVAHRIAEREPALRKDVVPRFPGDHWSQDDAFQAEEQRLVRSAADRERVDVGSVLDALDSHLRTHPSPEHAATVSPCKPRPFYD